MTAPKRLPYDRERMAFITNETLSATVVLGRKTGSSLSSRMAVKSRLYSACASCRLCLRSASTRKRSGQSGATNTQLAYGNAPRKLWSSGVPQWWRKATAASKTPRSKTTGAAVSFNRARSACASSSASAKKAERFCQGKASLPAACAAAITRRPGSGTVVIPLPASASINVDFPPPEHPVRRNLCIMRPK